MSDERTAIVTGAGKRVGRAIAEALLDDGWRVVCQVHHQSDGVPERGVKVVADLEDAGCADAIFGAARDLPPVRLLVNNARSEEHTSELQSHVNLVCRLLLEKKKTNNNDEQATKQEH